MTVSKTIGARGGILVAHDGSTHAEGALRTAARLATALHTHVTVVRVWNLGTSPQPDSWAVGYMPPLEEFEAAMLAALEHDVSPIRADNPDLIVTATVVHGTPAERLIEASASVDMIVIGCRGHGGFAGLMLGSVSEQVVRHARCPVLVDKSADHEEGDASQRHQMEQALTSELKLD